MCYENTIKTLAFFDLFNQPLIKDELFRYSWGSVVAASDDVIPAQAGIHVGKKDGLYFLSGREEIIEIRKAREKFLEKKLKIVERAVKKLRWVPFLRAVFLCNNVAMGTAEKKSDIDIFIVVKDGRIWIARFFATLFLSLFGLRRHGKKITNKICLSFYCSDKFLNLREIKICEPDIYLIYWIATLKPIYDPNNIWGKIKTANKWVLEFLPNAFGGEIGKDIEVIDNKFSKLFKNILEKMWQGGYGDLIESQAREAQKAKMKLNRDSAQNAGDSRVIISDKMLKFHENDRRVYYQERWLEKINILL